jgi:hypothetical protein
VQYSISLGVAIQLPVCHPVFRPRTAASIPVSIRFVVCLPPDRSTSGCGTYPTNHALLRCLRQVFAASIGTPGRLSIRFLIVFLQPVRLYAVLTIHPRCLPLVPLISPISCKMPPNVTNVQRLAESIAADRDVREANERLRNLSNTVSKSRNRASSSSTRSTLVQP